MVKEKHKTFYPCCFLCCCPSDPMHVTARIPVSGYTPGQTIDVEIDVNNRSDENGEFSVQLLKVNAFVDSSRQRLWPDFLSFTANRLLHVCEQWQNSTWDDQDVRERQRGIVAHQCCGLVAHLVANSTDTANRWNNQQYLQSAICFESSRLSYWMPQRRYCRISSHHWLLSDFG